MMIIGWLIRVETGIGSVFVFCFALLCSTAFSGYIPIVSIDALRRENEKESDLARIRHTLFLYN
jgi:hypothetical protein